MKICEKCGRWFYGDKYDYLCVDCRRKEEREFEIRQQNLKEATIKLILENCYTIFRDYFQKELQKKIREIRAFAIEEVRRYMEEDYYPEDYYSLYIDECQECQDDTAQMKIENYVICFNCGKIKREVKK